MKPRIQALRAIGTSFALTAINKYALWGLITFAILTVAIALLAYFFSNWWWIAMAPFGTLALVGLIAWLILRLVLKNIQPSMTKSQHESTKKFIENSQQLFENATTPYPILVIRLVIEVVLKRKDNLITETIGSSKGLREDFNMLLEEFKS